MQPLPAPLLTAAILATVLLCAAAPAPAADTPDILGSPGDWKPMFGSAPAEAAEAAGVRAVRLPCNFAGTRHERASWDREVRLDMTACRGIRFRLMSPDASPVGHFSFFLRSGDGWYVGTFAAPPRGRWETIRVAKADMHTEGRPAGWAGVSAIRLSGWRGKDVSADLFIADFALDGADAPLVIVRGESAATSRPGEMESVVRYAANVASALDALGQDYLVMSDLDLTAERLAGKRVAFLPHNPVMPDAAADALAAWMDAGGRIIAFYTLPPRIADAIGVAPGQHVGQKRSGDFAAIAPDVQALPGSPARVGQRSWNIHDARPADDRARVLARWLDDAGQDTGRTAVIGSDKGMFMTHVLLDDDPAAKRRMLLAMIGRLWPGAWAVSGRGSLAQVGRFGPFDGATTALEGIRARAVADAAQRGRRDAALASAEAHIAASRDAAAKESWPAAIDAAEAASAALNEAWCLAQQSRPGEHRAFWCHNAYGPAGMTWDESIRRLAENGFTAILPNMLWGGAAYYPSEVLPAASDVAERGDAVAQCLAACRKYGVEMHVWKVNYNIGWRAPKTFVERMRAEGRLQVMFDGSSREPWLCPSHPANQQLEIDSMVEVATKYDVHGVHFDYIRYPGPEGCFCPGCRERFEKAVGAAVPEWPSGVRKDDALRAKWLDFRREQITRVVAEVHRRVKAVRPACRVSAAVFRNWPLDRDSVGQDWKVWCDRGYLDFVCPMDYTPSDAQLEQWVTEQRKWAGRVPCYPGIGAAVWPQPNDAAKVIEQVNVTRRLETGGFTIFEYNRPAADTLVPLCGKGLTRAK
jgi:uncharacterized lipoprotein YddW (UPF0748 family)